MTLARAFETFRNNLNVSAGQQQQVAERHTRLIKLLQSTWGPGKIISIGSWKRGTAIPPVKDVDLMIVLSGVAPEQRSPDTILSEIEAKLRTAYPDIPTRKQARSIGLRFQDFSFDIVPALAKASGGYHIPDRSDARGWIFTNPEKHGELTAQTDQRCGGMAIPMVKMLKSWNAHNTAGLRSFHLEVMVLRRLKQQPPSYAEGVQLAFENLARDVKESCGDPGGSDNRLDKYLPAYREGLVMKLQDAATRMAQANRTQSQETARSVFGSPFP